MYTIPRDEIEGHQPKGGSPHNPPSAKQKRILRRAGYTKAEIEEMTSQIAYDIIDRHITPF